MWTFRVDILGCINAIRIHIASKNLPYTYKASFMFSYAYFTAFLKLVLTHFLSHSIHGNTKVHKHHHWSYSPVHHICQISITQCYYTYKTDFMKIEYPAHKTATTTILAYAIEPLMYNPVDVYTNIERHSSYIHVDSLWIKFQSYTGNDKVVASKD